MSSLASISPASAITSPDQTPNPSQTLGQAQFLQLLVTQMTQQDPLNPESDTDFAAQLAQFSSLQEQTTMAGDMANLQAESLLGATVTATSSTDSTQQTTGVVSGVDVSSGTPNVLVNGQLFSLSQITSIVPTQTPAATAAASSSNP